MEAVLRLQAPGVDIVNPSATRQWANPLEFVLTGRPVQATSRRERVSGVVDPGVGGERLPVVLHADGRWFVGPDNGLLNTVAVHSNETHWRIIEWRPTSFVEFPRP